MSAELVKFIEGLMDRSNEVVAKRENSVHRILMNHSHNIWFDYNRRFKDKSENCRWANTWHDIYLIASEVLHE